MKNYMTTKPKNTENTDTGNIVDNLLGSDKKRFGKDLIDLVLRLKSLKATYKETPKDFIQ